MSLSLQLTAVDGAHLAIRGKVTGTSSYRNEGVGAAGAKLGCTATGKTWGAEYALLEATVKEKVSAGKLGSKICIRKSCCLCHLPPVFPWQHWQSRGVFTSGERILCSPGTCCTHCLKPAWNALMTKSALLGAAQMSTFS